METGTRINSWTVIGPGTQKYKVLCRCVCGRTEREIRVYDLQTGKSKACRRCSAAASKTIHGHAGYGNNSSEYNSWLHMIQRCHNPNSKDYKNYGGRGIIVCDLWRSSFEAFLLQMGPKPDKKYTIERIDYNKNYEPGNTKWATRFEQNQNMRSNVKLTINGETKTVSEWSRHPDCTVTMFSIYRRLNRGWNQEDAVFKPKVDNARNK